MAKNEDDPARVAILQEWDAWAQWHPREAKKAGGMLFFTYLQKERSDLLIDFKASGDKWQIVHSWLLRERKVKS